jgi:hypothetical protein
MDYAAQIWNNSNLYGHCLTSLPGQFWNFATSDDLVTYAKPDPNTAKRVFLIFEEYTKTFADGSYVFGTNCLMFTYSELCFRRIVGTLLTGATSLTLAPLGFAIKVIHNTFS